jgi:hypothetical protein
MGQVRFNMAPGHAYYLLTSFGGPLLRECSAHLQAHVRLYCSTDMHELQRVSNIVIALEIVW